MIREKKSNIAKRKGFSLLELVIAIFVLTVGITGALKLIVSTLRVSMDTRNSVIASGLAQEGVELMRNIRDNNMLYTLSDLSLDPDASFKRFLYPINISTCIVDANYSYPGSGALTCNPQPSFVLYLNPTTNTYSHTSSGGTPTIFRRRIVANYYVNETINGNINQLSGMAVFSQVWWNGRSAPSGVGDCKLSDKCIYTLDYLPKRD